MPRKVVIHRAGSYDRLDIEQFESPRLGPSDIQIDVRAAGVNYADVIVRMGLYSSAKEFVGWPITPGFEVAGVVTGVGSAVEKFSTGDEVVAVTLFGGYTSELTVDARYVFHKPDNLEFAAAAALPAVMMTAWFALFELAHPRPGARMLVHSAAGGVGTSLAQLGKIRGCEVVGVVGGSHKIPTAREVGCDHVIDKSSQDLWSEAKRLAPDGYDVICDANGVETLQHSYDHLRRAGKLVVYGFATMMPRSGDKRGGKPNWLKLAAGWLRTPRFNPLDLTTDSKSVLAFNLSYLFDRTDLLELFIADLERWVASGEVVAPPVSEYDLDDVAQAHRDIESGTTVGKLVLVP
jgi:NADPH:quinone reductase-like Zn-dependent oxidoreductase